MTTTSATAGLLARVDARPLRRIGVVRISTGGSESHRESLFDVDALARWWRAGLTQVSATPRVVASLALRKS
jgi:hypothetical protein